MQNTGNRTDDKDKEAQEKKHKEICAKKRSLRKKKNKIKKNQFAVYK